MDWRGGRFKIVFIQENLLSSSTPEGLNSLSQKATSHVKNSVFMTHFSLNYSLKAGAGHGRAKAFSLTHGLSNVGSLLETPPEVLKGSSGEVEDRYYSFVAPFSAFSRTRRGISWNSTLFLYNFKGKTFNPCFLRLRTR